MTCVTSVITGEKREIPEFIEDNTQIEFAANGRGGINVAILEAPDYDKQDGVPYKLCIAYFEPSKTRARYNNANGVCEIARTWPKKGCGENI